VNPHFGWIRDATRALETIGAGNPRLEAEYMMARALGIPRIRLWLIDEAPSTDAIARFDALLARRLAREPLQYVLGTAEFAGLELEVGPGVFIPRSETEVLVEIAARRLEPMAGTPCIVDVCTGSGAILLALLTRFPDAGGIGIDVRGEAIDYARRNALRCGLDRRARLLRGDLFEPIAPSRSLDVVVSNPPYIRLDEAPALAPEIGAYEPHSALFAGEDGLDTVRRLIPQAALRLRAGGLLAMEIGITQADAVLGLLDSSDWRTREVLPDLTGRPRVVTAARG
jgi:release factor glutamine methyltransferase